MQNGSAGLQTDQGYQVLNSLAYFAVHHHVVELGAGGQLGPGGGQPLLPLLRRSRCRGRPAGAPAPPTTAGPGRRTWRSASWPGPAGPPAGRSPAGRAGLPPARPAPARVGCRTGARRAPLPTPAAPPRRSARRTPPGTRTGSAGRATSPGRGGRVVAETETKISGCSAASRATTVPLPTAVGPESTVRRAALTSAGRRAGGPGGELRDQRGGLVLAQPAEPPVGGDVQPFHHLGRPHRADPGQRPEHVDHLGVGDHVVLLGQGRAPRPGCAPRTAAPA